MTGQLYWITGLAGAGKSSLARKLFKALKPATPELVYLDGDTLRELFDANGLYREADRHRLALQYAHLCYLLTSQGVDVICATISMFDDVRAWNREHFPNYIEIYLKVSFSVLQKRDQNKLYSNHARQRINDAVGCDIDAQLPKQPDIVLCNNGDNTIEELVRRVLKKI